MKKKLPPPEKRIAYLPPPPPPTLPLPLPQRFQVVVEGALKGGALTTYTYRDDQMDKFIKDLWVWIHEDMELEISIKKTRV